MAERLASPSATACATLPPAASLNIVAWGVQGGAGLRRRVEETDGRRGTRGDKAGSAEGVAQVAQTSKQHCVWDGNSWFQGCCHLSPSIFRAHFTSFKVQRQFFSTSILTELAESFTICDLCVLMFSRQNVLIISCRIWLFLHKSLYEAADVCLLQKLRIIYLYIIIN